MDAKAIYRQWLDGYLTTREALAGLASLPGDEALRLRIKIRQSGW